jgi:hypothetical protein
MPHETSFCRFALPKRLREDDAGRDSYGSVGHHLLFRRRDTSFFCGVFRCAGFSVVCLFYKYYAAMPLLMDFQTFPCPEDDGNFYILDEQDIFVFNQVKLFL